MQLNQPVTIESLILANHVESAEGRLFISGAGWSIFRRPMSQEGGNVVSHLGIAVIIAVPWHQTNLQHDLILELRDEDAKALVSIPAPINVGRPAELRPGTIQYASVGLSMDTVFPHPGCYEVIAQLKDLEGSARRWAFQVQDIAQKQTTLVRGKA